MRSLRLRRKGQHEKYCANSAGARSRKCGIACCPNQRSACSGAGPWVRDQRNETPELGIGIRRVIAVVRIGTRRRDHVEPGVRSDRIDATGCKTWNTSPCMGRGPLHATNAGNPTPSGLRVAIARERRVPDSWGARSQFKMHPRRLVRQARDAAWRCSTRLATPTTGSWPRVAIRLRIPQLRRVPSWQRRVYVGPLRGWLLFWRRPCARRLWAWRQYGAWFSFRLPLPRAAS